MKFLLISTNRLQLPVPVMPLGACIVAEAAERAGHEVRLLDLMFATDPSAAIRAAVDRFQPDAVGLSVRNIDNNHMLGPVSFLDELLQVTDSVRIATGAPIILGGAALGIMPEEILRLTRAACAVTGEGGTVLPALLDRLEMRRTLDEIPGIALIKDGVFYRNLRHPHWYRQHCPAPDFRRWLNLPAYLSRQATAPIQTRTGCQFRCVYCSYPIIEGSRCRFRSPASVAHAVRTLADRGLRDIEIVDSIFNVPREHAMDICRELTRLKHGARIQCLELSPLGLDDALLTAMERAGFTGMGITLESASDRVLSGLGKGFASGDVQRAAEVVSRHSIPCTWIFMLGGPGETTATVRKTLSFAEEKIRPRDVAFFTVGIRLYPGTGLEAIARQQGILDESPSELLTPRFYCSPDVEPAWVARELERTMAGRMNFISLDTIRSPLVPVINRVGSALGLRPPLWRFTCSIRKGLRLAGLEM